MKYVPAFLLVAVLSVVYLLLMFRAGLWVIAWGLRRWHGF